MDDKAPTNAPPSAFSCSLHKTALLNVSSMRSGCPLARILQTTSRDWFELSMHQQHQLDHWHGVVRMHDHDHDHVHAHIYSNDSSGPRRARDPDLPLLTCLFVDSRLVVALCR